MSKEFTRAEKWSPPSRPRSATKKQAIAQYQTQVADTLLAVRLAYYDVLLAVQQITVNEASVKLLQKELDDQQRRFDAGTVPHFNVLRAEVARGQRQAEFVSRTSQYRISKKRWPTCSATICRARFWKTSR